VADGGFVARPRAGTDRQGASGLGLDARRRAVSDRPNGGDRGRSRPGSSRSGAVGGTTGPSRQGARRRHGAAPLVLARLDGLARDVAAGTSMAGSGVGLAARDLPRADRLTVHILAAVAGHEREQISARARAALAVAGARGGRLGDPNPTAEARAADLRPPVAEIAAAGHASPRAIAAGLDARGVPAAHGPRPPSCACLLGRATPGRGPARDARAPSPARGRRPQRAIEPLTSATELPAARTFREDRAVE
jgi:hypothetical protein